MKRAAMKRFCIILAALLLPHGALAASQVYQLRGGNSGEVVAALRGLHGDAVRIEQVNDRLLLVGPAERLEQIVTLLAEIDRPPLPLRLTLSTTPPPPPGATVYATSDPDSYQIETIEQALVAIDHQRLAQRASSSDGWLVTIEEQPVEVRSLMLQIRRVGADGIEVLTSFAQRDGDQRRVLGNHRAGRFGEWLPLLPTPATAAATEGNRYTSAHRAQLWLRVEPLDSH